MHEPEIATEVACWLDEVECARNKTLYALLDPPSSCDERFDLVADLLHAVRGLEMQLRRFVDGDAAEDDDNDTWGDTPDDHTI